MNIRVLLADDHALLRELMRRLLRSEPGIEVVGEVANGRELLARVRDLRPDVVVLDIAMPELNGIDAAARLVARHPGVRILCLTAHTAANYVRAMLAAGAVGYVNKQVASSELVRAVRAVASGQTYLCPEAAAVAVGAMQPDAGSARPHGSVMALGRREREVLQLIAEGRTAVEIAERLSVSHATVETHRRNIMRKLDLHSAVELTRFAIRQGLVEP